jgi:hypothetical protein
VICGIKDYHRSDAKSTNSPETTDAGVSSVAVTKTNTDRNRSGRQPKSPMTDRIFLSPTSILLRPSSLELAPYQAASGETSSTFPAFAGVRAQFGR